MKESRYSWKNLQETKNTAAHWIVSSEKLPLKISRLLRKISGMHFLQAPKNTIETLPRIFPTEIKAEHRKPKPKIFSHTIQNQHNICAGIYACKICIPFFPITQSHTHTHTNAQHSHLYCLCATPSEMIDWIQLQMPDARQPCARPLLGGSFPSHTRRICSLYLLPSTVQMASENSND